MGTTSISGKLQNGTAFTTVRVEDPELIKSLEAQNVEIRGQAVNSSGGILGVLLTWILPMVFIVGLWYWFIGRNKGGAGSMGNIFSFGKSKARVIQGEQTGVSFLDVGGAGEAVTDLKEVTEFLKNPDHFQRLGGKMPKGVLLVGPPGTGKTLLARATAGEAGGQFFNLSGAEFVEMFVGVGASRYATSSCKPRRARLRSSSSMKLTPSEAAGPAQARWGCMRARANPQPAAGRDGWV